MQYSDSPSSYNWHNEEHYNEEVSHSSHPDPSTDCEGNRWGTQASQIDHQVVDEELVSSQLES